VAIQFVTTLLAIETSSIACSVALAHEGCVVEDHRLVPRQHNALVLGMIDGLFASVDVQPGQLDAIVYGRGPGSFTGVRIAAAIAQGLSLATAAPTIGVSSLEAMARAVLADRAAAGVIATLASRPGEMYVGAFQVSGGEVECLGSEQVGPAESIVVPPIDLAQWLVVGEAAALLQSRWPGTPPRFIEDVWPRATAMLDVGAVSLAVGVGIDETDAAPVYLQVGQPWQKSRS
jgi:tRNA threonylcarbamoyladenosine biosynthesis protein TsaB